FVAVISELMQVGQFPSAQDLEVCLDLLCSRKTRIKQPRGVYDDRITPAIISFLEVCLYRNLPAQKILRALRHYVPVKANRMVYSSHLSQDRTMYLKAL